MSGVVFIICIPTEHYEKCLPKKVKKKVIIDAVPKSIPSQGLHDSANAFEDNFRPSYLSDLKPHNKKEVLSMEQILRNILNLLNITNYTWCKNDQDKYLQVIFSVESSDRCEEILEILKDHHIGKHLNSTVSVIPCTIQYHGQENTDTEQNSKFFEEDELTEESHEKKTAWNRFVLSVRARLTVAQIVENVKIHAALTFDFLFLILISTIMCAIGLVENSNVYLLSSMLICPMMGPVMGGTFGTVIEHKRLLKMGVQNELLGLGIATVVGFCYGSIICMITDKYGNQTWPTQEMISRCELRSLWVGCLVALLSGAAVALGILSDNIASLVGVAISTSLTPPAVNAGLLWSLASVYSLKTNENARYQALNRTSFYSENYTTELRIMGAISICLTFVNIICIYVAAILVFKIKEVAPMSTKDHIRQRFWKHDIKIARDYNKTLQSEEGGCIISKLSAEIAEYKRKASFSQNQFYHSTEFPQEHFKINIKTPEYPTWSPCMNLTNQYRDINELLENLIKCKPSNDSTRLINLNASKSRCQHRRLSQIFNHDEDKLNTIKESGNEKSPTLTDLSSDSNKSGIDKQFFHGTKKFIVTPCELDLLKK